MVKHNQTTRRQKLTNCLSVSDHSVGLALKGLMQLCNIGWEREIKRITCKKYINEEGVNVET